MSHLVRASSGHVCILKYGTQTKTLDHAPTEADLDTFANEMSLEGYQVDVDGSPLSNVSELQDANEVTFRPVDKAAR